MESPSTKLPPVLVEIQNIIDLKFIQRTIEYNLAVIKKHNVSPIIVVFGIRPTKPSVANDLVQSDQIPYAARALLNNHVFSSSMYRRIKSESRGGNNYVLFHAAYKSTYRWYVGCVLFYFQHKNFSHENNNQFLVFVDVLKGSSAAEDDNTIPVVTLNGLGRPPKYAVISLNDFQRQVGLVQTSINSLEHKVVAPYMIFDRNAKETAGQLDYI